MALSWEERDNRDLRKEEHSPPMKFALRLRGGTGTLTTSQRKITGISEHAVAEIPSMSFNFLGSHPASSEFGLENLHGGRLHRFAEHRNAIEQFLLGGSTSALQPGRDGRFHLLLSHHLVTDS
jgi:hypothetical protein